MEFKEKGNAALKAKDYAEAIKCYTQAIDSGEATDSQHVFYGNRSAANLLSGDKDAALKDAKKCVSLKSDWAKGHSRLGAAFHAKNQFSMAKDAYKKAMELDPSSASFKASFEDANKRDRINRGLEQPTKPAWAPASAPGQYAQQQQVREAVHQRCLSQLYTHTVLHAATCELVSGTPCATVTK